MMMMQTRGGEKMKIRELREKAGLTQSQLAKALGVGETTIRNWEQGRAGDRLQQLALLCSVLECQPGDLLEVAPDKK